MSDTVSTVPAALNDLNPNYKIRISGQDELGNDVDIVASAPEEFSIDVNAEWEPLLGAMYDQLIERAGRTAQFLSTAAKAVGYTTNNVFMTQQVWTRSSPIELKLPIRFNAVYNANQEVTIPVMQLLSLCLPSTAGTGNVAADESIPLIAPGPTLAGNSPYKIKIQIGNVFTFNNVIITGVSAVFTTLPTTAGDYISCDVDLSVRTSRILTKRGLLDVFRNVMPEGNAAAIPTPNNRMGNAALPATSGGFLAPATNLVNMVGSSLGRLF